MRYCAIDIETQGLRGAVHEMWMISVFYEGKLWVEHDCKGMRKLSPKLTSILQDESVCKIIHSAEFDVPFIQQRTGVRVRNIWDTRLAEIVILGTNIPRGSKDEKLKAKFGNSLKHTLQRYGLPTLDKTVRENFIDRKPGTKFTEEEIEYAKDDVRYLPALREAQEFILKRDGLLELALLENKVVERVAQMKVRGIGLDKVLWMEIADRNKTLYTKLQRELPNKVSNWNSPAQVKKFFQSRGVALFSFEDLEKVQRESGDTILKKFIEMRSYYSNATAYSESWLYRDDGSSVVDKDGRIRCSWEQLLNTGRFATSDPNLLAIPREGMQRAAFVPARGHVFVIGDFSGQEIGIMAAASREAVWIDAGLRGDDIHSLTASLLYRGLWEEGAEDGCTFPAKCDCSVHKKLRQYAKTLNFMLAYGGGPEKFSHSTGVDMLEAKIIIRRYKRVIPKLTRWLEKNATDAIRSGESYSASPYRRRRVLRGQEEWQIRNQGKNNPVQAAGADMLKLSMISLPEKYPLALVWHDEIILEVPKAEANKALKVLKTIMEQSADYVTGIKGLIKVEPRIATNLLKK